MEQESTSHLSSSSARDEEIAQSREQEVHPPAPAASFHTLPNELVYHVFSMLPPAAAAALGLTCKPMWALLNSQHTLKQLLTSRAERLAFLSLIEHQFPNRLLCHFCRHFHLRPSKRPAPSRPKIHQPTPCDRLAGHICHFQSQLRIPFANAQEVMNAHRFGPAHGLAASTLTHTVRIKRIHPTIFRRTAAIANGDLLLMTDAISTRSTTAFIGWGHMAGHMDSIGVNTILRILTASFISPAAPDLVLLRCPTCGCEARGAVKKSIVTEAETKKYEMEIRATSWCNLGPCRTPHDPRWERAVYCPERCRGAVMIGAEAELKYVGFFDDRSPARFWEETGRSGGGRNDQLEVRAGPEAVPRGDGEEFGQGDAGGGVYTYIYPWSLFTC
ncbi:hypothetical protein FQN53_007288 [Emmonsiellopsis sp. PD_33]|nr:hypothetical protein FQN53_007288 [Emmonsiellopsis sp. PD_33]